MKVRVSDIGTTLPIGGPDADKPLGQAPKRHDLSASHWRAMSSGYEKCQPTVPPLAVE